MEKVKANIHRIFVRDKNAEMDIEISKEKLDVTTGSCVITIEQEGEE